MTVLTLVDMPMSAAHPDERTFELLAVAAWRLSCSVGRFGNRK